MNNTPIIVIAGPTGVGKSKLGITLAKKLNGEIISCDSMQVYRHMDIGTAKVTKEEMDGIKHHMIDVLDPTEPFDVVQFQRMTKDAINKVFSNGKLPILVGGTGFYIQSVLKEIDFISEEADNSYREELESLAKTNGAEYLHEILKKVDPESANQIHQNNIKRTIRALEFYHKTGTPISLHNQKEREKKSAYDSLFFVLTDDREVLYERINERVDQMIEQGLVSEVEFLLQNGCKSDMTSMQGIGYKQLIPYVQGKIELYTAVEQIKQESRHYAKRQLTWFRRESDTIWINRKEFHSEEELIKKVESYIPDYFNLKRV